MDIDFLTREHEKISMHPRVLHNLLKEAAIIGAQEARKETYSREELNNEFGRKTVQKLVTLGIIDPNTTPGGKWRVRPCDVKYAREHLKMLEELKTTENESKNLHRKASGKGTKA